MCSSLLPMKSEEMLMTVDSPFDTQTKKQLTIQSGILNIIASDFDARPMSYLTSKGDRSGYEPELARLICQRLNLKPVWHNLPMEDFYSAIKSGDSDNQLHNHQPYDVVWFNQAITPERERFVSFSAPYGLFDEAVVVKAASNITSSADLAGLRVGGLADSTNIALVEGFPGVEAVPYPGSDKVLPEMLAALRAGEIDALIDDELVLLVAAGEDQALRLAFSLPTQVPFAIGVNKEQDALLEALNRVLSELKDDGTLAELWAKWIPWKAFPFS